MSDQPRGALWTCPHCGEERRGVIGCWGKAQHLWEAHGIPGKFTMNGRTTYYGPQNETIDT